MGSNLVAFFGQKKDYEVFGTSLHPSHVTGFGNFSHGDLSDPEYARSVIQWARPDCVINTVALTDMEKCEEQPDLAHRLNVATAQNLAKAIEGEPIRLIHISTDQFFNDNDSLHTENCLTSPPNEYGRTKLKAEQVCLNLHRDTTVIRTNFYGWSGKFHKQTFGEWVYGSLKERQPINLFTNYFFTPIEISHLASALERVIRSDFTGLLNVAGPERCSKYEFGLVLADVFGLDPSPIRPAEMVPGTFKARRPYDISLSVEKFTKLFQIKLPNLRKGLETFYNTKPPKWKKR